MWGVDREGTTYVECVECHSDRIKHAGRGYCRTCKSRLEARGDLIAWPQRPVGKLGLALSILKRALLDARKGEDPEELRAFFLSAGFEDLADFIAVESGWHIDALELRRRAMKEIADAEDKVY